MTRVGVGLKVFVLCLVPVLSNHGKLFGPLSRLATLSYQGLLSRRRRDQAVSDLRRA